MTIFGDLKGLTWGRRSRAFSVHSAIHNYMYARVTRYLYSQLLLRPFAIHTVCTFICIWQPFSAAYLSCLAYGVGITTITMSTDSPWACPRSVGGLKVFKNMKNVVHTFSINARAILILTSIKWACMIATHCYTINMVVLNWSMSTEQ